MFTESIRYVPSTAFYRDRNRMDIYETATIGNDYFYRISISCDTKSIIKVPDFRSGTFIVIYDTRHSIFLTSSVISAR